MKTVYSITKCFCFLNKSHRQDVIKSNCNCDHPIVNLETYGDQLFGYNQIFLSEEDKVIFTQKIAEMEATKSLPTPPPSAKKSRGDYDRNYLPTDRARPISGAFNFPPPDDVDMDDPVPGPSLEQDQINMIMKPVIETMVAQGNRPFAIMKIWNSMVVALRLPESYLLSEYMARKIVSEVYQTNSDCHAEVVTELAGKKNV